MSLEKRIKRRIVGRRHEFLAINLPGFESLCADELAGLSATIGISDKINGGVLFNGRMSDLYLAALHARIPVRLLLRMARFNAANFQQLERQIERIDWELYLPGGLVPELHVTARHSRLYHTGAVAGHISRCIAAHWAELGIGATPSDGQTLYVRLENDTVTLSLDGCGAPLYQRGLKPHTAAAPLRESTAAAVLTLAGFQPDLPLMDPMCGSGTFSLEAALMSKEIPPGLFREFAFMQWPGFRPQQWHYFKKSAHRQVRRLDQPLIHASDSDEKAVGHLKACIARNRFGDAITVSKVDFFDLNPGQQAAGKGLVVLNPPYGRRLKARGALEGQYGEIAAKLKSDYKGWRIALLVPRKRLAMELELPLRHHAIQHGGLNLTLLTGRI